MNKEPNKFYDFVKHLYHPEAKPNIIHKTIAKLQNNKNAAIITQNIDELHNKAKSLLTCLPNCDFSSNFLPFVVKNAQKFLKKTCRVAISLPKPCLDCKLCNDSSIDRQVNKL